RPPGGQPAYAIFTGGTTGSPKLVRFPFQGPSSPPALLARCRWRRGQRCFLAGSLGHVAAFTALVAAFADPSTTALAEVCEPTLVARMLEREAIAWTQLTPTHMRLLQPHLGSIRRSSTLAALLHTAGPCPPDTRRAWIEALGAEHVYEMYGATE